MEKLKERLTEALFPAFCISCKKISDIAESPWLCKVCTANLRPRFETFCHICGKERNLGFSNTCAHASAALSSVTAIFLYENAGVRRLIHALKYYFLLDTLETFKNSLSTQRTDLLRLDPDVIVPLPLHSRKLRERGFNQAELIAKQVAEIIKKPLATNILFKSRSTPPQMKTKNPRKRAKNIRGVFRVENPELACGDLVEPVEGKNILLVDDVVTTGSTLEEAARTLKQAGANSVRAFVLARD